MNTLREVQRKPLQNLRALCVKRKSRHINSTECVKFRQQKTAREWIGAVDAFAVGNTG
jgi:hypothetical protein